LNAYFRNYRTPNKPYWCPRICFITDLYFFIQIDPWGHNHHLPISVAELVFAIQLTAK
jgi:hypothetical protein